MKGVIHGAINFWIREVARLGDVANLDEKERAKLEATVTGIFNTLDVHIDFGYSALVKDMYHIGTAIYLAVASALIGKTMKQKVSNGRVALVVVVVVVEVIVVVVP